MNDIERTLYVSGMTQIEQRHYPGEYSSLKWSVARSQKGDTHPANK